MTTQPVRFLMIAAALLATLPLAPPDTGRIAGHVRDAGGTPLANAQVIVVGTRLTAVTNPSGAYLISAVPAGMYLLRAQLNGYSPAAVHGVRVAAGQTVTVDVVLQGGPVSLNEIVIPGVRSSRTGLPVRPREREPWAMPSVTTSHGGFGASRGIPKNTDTSAKTRFSPFPPIRSRHSRST
jgi:hypothetical protein